ncbi:MAG: hypothetical protein Q8Q49_04880 [bacterium]|nr:hypothetical protein [bacterium]
MGTAKEFFEKQRGISSKKLEPGTDSYDPRDVAGEAAFDIPEAITDALQEAEIRIDNSAGNLVLQAVRSGICPGDVLRDIFNSLADHSPEPIPGQLLPGEVLVDLSTRIKQTSTRIDTPSIPKSPIVGHPPTLDPSAFISRDLPVTREDFSCFMPPSSNQPDGSIMHKKRPEQPIPEVI